MRVISLHMLFAIPAEQYQLNPVIEQVMNQILVLHADHGQCASTTTVRAAGLPARIFCLYCRWARFFVGPTRQTNEASMRMLEEIQEC